MEEPNTTQPSEDGIVTNTSSSFNQPPPPVTNPIPEFSDGSPLLKISLKEYLYKFCRTVHDHATVSKAYGEYVKTEVDPNEQYCHVDFPSYSPNLALIYSLDSWKFSLARHKSLKEASELSREERFAMEERGKELAKKFAERDSMIYLYMNICRKRFPAFYNKLGSSEKKLREYIICFLNGQGKKEVLERLDIDEDAIALFKALPTPSHEENSVLELLESIKENQAKTKAESMKDAIVSKTS